MHKNIKDLVREIQENKPEQVTQEVVPAKKKKNENNEQCSFYIDKKLKKNLKFKAVEEGKTITEVIVRSIEAYLKN